MGYNPNQPRDPAGTPDGGQWTLVEGKGVLGRGKFAAVDRAGKTSSNYHENKDEALREARQRALNEQFASDAAKARASTDKAIMDRIKSGAEVSDSDLAHLKLRGKSDMRDFIPRIAEMGDVKPRDVRKHLDGLIKKAYSDSGAKYEVVNTKEALKRLAKSKK